MLSLFAVVWMAHLAHVGFTPPVDYVEQLTWVRSLEWGYYKHPPLPTWLLWLPTRLFGWSATTVYAMGAACALSAIGLLWHLLKKLRGFTYATVALLAVLCITYYNFRTFRYNHNIVLMLLSTVSAMLCWRAFATRQLRWWFGLGLALGLGALAKYQIAVTMLSVLIFAAHQGAWRDPLHRRGALLACVVAFVVFAPHIHWLLTHDFEPIRYAMESSIGGLSSTERVTESSIWLVDQILNRALPALIFLAAVARSLWVAQSAVPSPASSWATLGGDQVRVLLLAWGLVPLAFIPLVGMFSGGHLPKHWGSPFLLFLVPAAMELLPRIAWHRADITKVLSVFVVIQGLLLGLSYLISPSGPFPPRVDRWQAFDSTNLAEQIARPARVALGGPIRVVIGEASIAGALAVRLPEHPVVLIDGRFDRSPWVAPDLVRRCGALQLGPVQALVGGMPLGGSLPDLAWRVVSRDATAAPCPPLSRH